MKDLDGVQQRDADEDNRCSEQSGLSEGTGQFVQENVDITTMTVSERLVWKMAQKGLTTQEAFRMLDVNSDGLLTVEEIMANLRTYFAEHFLICIAHRDCEHRDQ